VEKRLLGRNAVHLGGNVQPREGEYRGGLYEEKEGQIM